MPDLHPYRITITTPSGTLTLEVIASSRAHAITSGQELSGLGRHSQVTHCCRLGEW